MEPIITKCGTPIASPEQSGLVVSILIGVSWIVSGFASIPLAWKFGLGTVLGLVAADYLLLAVTGASIRERWVDG